MVEYSTVQTRRTLRTKPRCQPPVVNSVLRPRASAGSSTVTSLRAAAIPCTLVSQAATSAANSAGEIRSGSSSVCGHSTQVGFRLRFMCMGTPRPLMHQLLFGKDVAGTWQIR